MVTTLNIPLPATREEKLTLHKILVKYCYAENHRTITHQDRPFLVVNVHLRPNADWDALIDVLPGTVTAMRHGVPIVCKGHADAFLTHDNTVVPIPHPAREALLPKLNHIAYSHSRFSDRQLKVHMGLADIHLLKAWDILYVGTEKGQDYYATPQQHALEKALLLNALARQNEGHHPVSHDALNRYGKELSDEQRAAMVHINGRDGIVITEGMAGTGKSTMMKATREVWEHCGYVPIGMALSGKAQAGLQAGSGIPSSTIHLFLINLENGQTLHSKNILVVDEAGMVPSSLMARLVTACASSGAKLVLLGDDRQLQPIEAGGPFKVLKDALGSARLTTIYRQRERWAQESVHAFADGRAQDALTVYQEKGCYHTYPDTTATLKHLVARWDSLRTKDCQHDYILAGKRDEVARLNTLARQARVDKGDIQADETVMVKTKNGRIALAPGDRVLFSKNNAGMGVTNGQLATVRSVNDETLTVLLDDGDYRVIDTLEYDEFDHGYAMTVHKAQGVTVERTYGLVSSNMDREMAYVMMSRFRESHHLFVDSSQFSHTKVIELMNRPRTKNSSVDNIARYDHAFWCTVLSEPEKLNALKNKDSDMVKALKLPTSQQALKNPALWEYVVAHHCVNLTYSDHSALLQAIAPMPLQRFIPVTEMVVGL